MEKQKEKGHIKNPPTPQWLESSWLEYSGVFHSLYHTFIQKKKGSSLGLYCISLIITMTLFLTAQKSLEYSPGNVCVAEDKVVQEWFILAWIIPHAIRKLISTLQWGDNGPLSANSNGWSPDCDSSWTQLEFTSHVRLLMLSSNLRLWISITGPGHGWTGVCCSYPVNFPYFLP